MLTVDQRIRMLTFHDRPSIIKRALRLALTLSVGLALATPTLAANHSVQGAKKEEGGFETEAPQAILIEASSGSVLFEKNADQLSAPSSMIKLMTMEVVFNALTQGKINLSDEYVVSENAWRKGGAPSGGATMFAAIHSRVKVEDLLRGAIIDNANDACMILAEGIASNERAFAGMMTARARELGLTQSGQHFANSSGLQSDPGNLMTVRELGQLAHHIIVTYPDFFKIYNERDYTWNKIAQQNRNALLNSLSSADGFTTGYSKEGGYGMVATAMENGTRLIVAINGMDDPDDRIAEAKRILEWGFRNFETRAVVYRRISRSAMPKVFGGDSGSVALATQGPDAGAWFRRTATTSCWRGSSIPGRCARRSRLGNKLALSG